jgi:lauroyl/myristoyl acyltransferase
VTTRERRLEAPHRRLAPGRRRLEKAAVAAYRATAWLIGHVPPGPAAGIIGRGAQLSYLLWPTKRRWSNANFGHVLGRPPDDPEVRRLALRAYHGYARYLVELMRLPSYPPERVATLVDAADMKGIEPIWRESEGGLIFVLGHVGNNEAVAAGIASRGWPINVVADDSAFPEMFELFRRQRESWGVRIIPWRNLREIFSVLKRREMLALLVDWGYRADGIPVRLFDAWTTLPAGPATLAAKTRSRILPVTIRRTGTDRFHLSWGEPFAVPSSSTIDLQQATQRIADELSRTIGVAPEQWYNFKPLWPDTAAESSLLERRAQAMLAGGLPGVSAGMIDDGPAALLGTAPEVVPTP